MSEPLRLFAPDLPAQGGEVVLGPEPLRHARVLRLAPGARVRLFDGRGREADAIVQAIDADGLRCLASSPVTVEVPGPRVVLVQVAPKAKKLDGIVRMTTELGVSEIRLALAERSEKVPRSVERFERIAREAARQSRRATVPSVHAPLPLLDVAALAPRNSSKIAAWEDADAPIPMLPNGDVWLVVGAEGGLTAAEVTGLRALGYAAIGLGPTTLRVETAAPVAVGLVLDRLRR